MKNNKTCKANKGYKSKKAYEASNTSRAGRTGQMASAKQKSDMDILQETGKETSCRTGRIERTELRTGTTKTFENCDHTMTTELYLTPIHYQKEDGTWEEMDDTLREEAQCRRHLPFCIPQKA